MLPESIQSPRQTRPLYLIWEAHSPQPLWFTGWGMDHVVMSPDSTIMYVASHLCLGFVLSSWFSQNSWHLLKIPTVTGLQGIFFNLSTWKKRQEAQPKMQGVFFLIQVLFWTKIQATLIHVPACCVHPFPCALGHFLTNKQTIKTKGRKSNQLCQRWPTVVYHEKTSQLLISPASSQGILGRLLPLGKSSQTDGNGRPQAGPSLSLPTY